MTTENTNHHPADLLTRLGLPAPGSLPCSGPAAGRSPAYRGIVFRSGPTGPRAALIDGPDIWETIAALYAVVDDDPELCGEALMSEWAAVTGIDLHRLTAAADYFAAHVGEIDSRIRNNIDTAARLNR